VNPVKAKTAFDIDRDALVQIFARKGLDEKAAYTAAGVQAKIYKFKVGPSLLKTKRQRETS